MDRDDGQKGSTKWPEIDENQTLAKTKIYIAPNRTAQYLWLEFVALKFYNGSFLFYT